MPRVLIVDKRKEVADSRADVLRDLGYDVTVATGLALPGRFDSVLYVAGDLHPSERENLGKIRNAYPQAKIVVYSSELGLDVLAEQIALVHAETLPMIKTSAEIAEALR